MVVYQNDHIGTPQKITGINGAVVWSAKYTSFGKATIETETIVNNLRFAGQYEDLETELHYNWNRYYDHKVGKYLRKDPIGFHGGINLYNYAHNNPIAFSDPSGKIPSIRVWKILGCGKAQLVDGRVVYGKLASGEGEEKSYCYWECVDGKKDGTCWTGCGGKSKPPNVLPPSEPPEEGPGPPPWPYESWKDWAEDAETGFDD